jgi:asparagine synthetase B (glutamine-hydrolysing)
MSRTQAFHQVFESQGNRVLLSGVGGDEFLGGIPAAVPQLADLLSRAHFLSFLRCGRDWALVKRVSVLQLATETIRSFLRPATEPHAVRWVTPTFAKSYGGDAYMASLPFAPKFLGKVSSRLNFSSQSPWPRGREDCLSSTL